MNTYTTDTHALVWAINADKRLSKSATEIFKKADAGEARIIIPPIVAIEAIRIDEKHALGLSFSEFFDRIRVHHYYSLYPLEPSLIRIVARLKQFKDLHDRIVIATALVTRTPLITCDTMITKSDSVDIYW